MPKQIDITKKEQYASASPNFVGGRVARLIRFIELLGDTEGLSADEIAERLAVSRRTVFRDLKLLQQAGVDLTSKSGQGYRLSEKPIKTTLDIGPIEALGLLLLGKLADAMPAQPLFAQATQAVHKIITHLPEEASEVYSDLMNGITIAPGGVDFSYNDDKHFRTLQYCIEERIICKLSYQGVDEKQKVITRIRPLHLHFYKRTCYLLAYSQQHQQVRMFKLARVLEITHNNENFSPIHFSMEEFLDDAWGIIPGSRKYKIVIEFSPRVATNVSEVRWHRTQQVSFTPDGSCVLRFTVSGIDEIKWWILGYGDQAIVRAPHELRDAVRDIAIRTVRNYEQI